jgi:phage terminase small subunit
MKSTDRIKPVVHQPPPAPSKLRPATQAWFTSVVSEWRLEAHHIMLLEAAAGAWDRMQAAQAVLDEQGMTFLNQHQCPQTRPEVAIERDSRLAFARLIRELDLDLEPPKSHDDFRPPYLFRHRGK